MREDKRNFDKGHPAFSHIGYDFSGMKLVA
jgi:hypothetical protein